MRSRYPNRLGSALCAAGVLILVSVAPQAAPADLRVCPGTLDATRAAEIRLDGDSGAQATDSVFTLDFSAPLSLADCLRYAESHSAALRAAEAKWRAAESGVAAVGSLPDPTITYGYFLDEVETRAGPQKQKIGVRQRLPWFGTIGLAGDAAGAAAAAERERYRGARLSLLVEVTDAYLEYAYLARAWEIVGARLELVRGLEAVARARYSAGDASFADVTRAQIELARMENEHEGIEARREPLSARLGAAMNVGTARALPWPEGIPDAPTPVSEEEARGLLGRGNPELRALDFEVARAATGVRLARRRYFPDITIGLDYIMTDEASMPVDESGKDPLVATASISLPLWFGKHAGTVSAARSSEAALLGAKAQRERDLEARLEALLYEIGDARRKVALYEDRLLPLARQSYASTEAAYRAGAADFDSLIGAHEIALEFELGLAHARADLVLAAARLRRLIGHDGTVAPGDGTSGREPRTENRR